MAIILYWKAGLSFFATGIHGFSEPTATPENIGSMKLVRSKDPSLAVKE
jgi:hypothetical protein